MMRMRYCTALLAVGLALTWMASASIPASAQDPQTVLDHFLCYAVQPPGYTGAHAVSLVDQFANGPAKVVSRSLLCNPVEKARTVAGLTATKLIHPNAHLMCYKAAWPALYRKVSVTNQFGNATLAVRDAAMLCLPSSKTVGQKRPAAPALIPPGLDHFKCYAAKQLTPVRPETVFLKDQFTQSEATAYQAVALCNPTEKIAGAQKTQVLYPYAHLVCYTVQLPEKDHIVWITDQFESNEGPLHATMVRLLCLPSTELLG